MLGEILLFGDGVKQDRKKAFKLIESAAIKGEPTAMARLSQCYNNGFGVKTNEQKGFYWTEKGAAVEEPMCQANLAAHYKEGINVPKDFSKAFDLAKQAALQGNPHGIEIVSECYELGEGVGKNLVEAYAYMNVAATADRDLNEKRNKIEKSLSSDEVKAAQKRSAEIIDYLKERGIELNR
jgi:hypothetical protein